MGGCQNLPPCPNYIKNSASLLINGNCYDIQVICCHGFNVYMKLEILRETENRALGRKINKIACFKVKLNWTRWSFFVFASKD